MNRLERTIATGLAALVLSTGNAQESWITDPAKTNRDAPIAEQADEREAYAPFNLHFDDVTGGEAISVAAVLDDIPASSRFHTLRREATGAPIELEAVLNAVNVNEDGTGTYRILEPVAHQEFAAYASRLLDQTRFSEDHRNNLTFYEANLSDRFTPEDVGTRSGLGTTPLDAITRMLTSAHAQSAIKSESELENRWTETVRYNASNNTRSDEWTDESRFEERIASGNYGIIVAPEDITVRAMTYGSGENTITLYEAVTSNAASYLPTFEALGGSTLNTIDVERK